MDNKPNHIDEYFKGQLEGLEMETSRKLWTKLYWLLIYKKLLLWAISIGLTALIPFVILNYSNQNEALPPKTNEITYTTKSYSETLATSPLQNKMEVHAKQDKKQIPAQREEKSSHQQSEAVEMIPIPKENVSHQRVANPHTSNMPKRSSLEKDRMTDNATQDQPDLFYTHSDSQMQNSKADEIAALNAMYTIRFNQITPGAFSIKNHISKRDNMQQIPVYGGDEESNTLNKGSWAVGVFISPNYVNTQLKADEAYNDYLAKRRKSETTIFPMDYSVEIQYSLKHYFIKTGIGYSTYGQNANYSFTSDEIDPNLSFTQYDTTWVWIYDPPYAYPRVSGIDSTFIPIYQSGTLSTQNRYTFIEIPLIVGVRLRTDKKTGFEIGAGGSFGTLISTRGKLPELQGSSFQKINKSSSLLKNTSVNFILQTSIIYKLGEKTKLMLSPYYKQNLGSVFEKSFPVRQKFSKLGVSIGIKFKL